ncbi:MAG: helix-turn-helix transcriptional regulator [Halioglobus sp.]
MKNSDLLTLGAHIAALRIARQFKQTELAYEAGVSHRTLQRLEAGEPVKSDGLIKVIKCLGRLDGVLGALHDSGFSPYERLAEAGLKVSELRKQRDGGKPAKSPSRKRRVRHAQSDESRASAGRAGDTVAVQWPEDQ